MKNMSGFVVYMEYLAGTTKGATTDGDLINGVFGLGDVDKNYTSNLVNETLKGSNTKLLFADITKQINKAFTLGNGEKAEVKAVHVSAEGVKTVVFGVLAEEDVDLANATFYNEDGTEATFTPAEGDEVFYYYDNVVIPQKKGSLPEIRAELKSIVLTAKTRRIAINYAQIAQFQAQTEYGLDIGKALAEQAVATLQFEIDTEIVEGLKDAAITTRKGAIKDEANFDLHLPVGVSMQDHFASFANRIDLANEIIYGLTKKFTCTYLVASASLLKVLRFCPGWKPANVSNLNGPYLAGTLENIKVFVTPSYKDEYVFGVNGSDLMTSAAVYAPYMPIIPTALLGLPDGSIKQGFSTCYDFKIINPDLLVYGQLKGRMFGAN